MDNPEEVLHILDEFAKVKPKDIPKELEDYLSYVARTGDPVYQWSLVKSLFREKLLRVITDFYESTALLNPPSPAGDNFNYEAMKRVLLERLETFSNAPFTVQRLCELLTAPRKQYNRTDKFMRAIEKNVLVVSTREPGTPSRQDNAPSEIMSNGVAEGESVTQAVNNDTAHIQLEPLHQTEGNVAVESSSTEENHLDIGSNEAEVAKDFDPINVGLHSSDETVHDKLVSDTEDETVKTVDSEAHSSLVQQAKIIENIEPVDRIDCISSEEPSDTIGPDSTERTTSLEDPTEVEVSENPVSQEDLKPEEEEVADVKEGIVLNGNDIVCGTKNDEVDVQQATEECASIVEKPLAEESDVSCSSSDNHIWTHTEAEEPVSEPDSVSTTEVVSEASSSDLVQDAVFVEEPVDTCSSDDSQRDSVQPEQSDVSEPALSEKSDEPVLDILKNIDSTSDSTAQPKNETDEEDPVGTTNEIDTSEVIKETSEDIVQQDEDQLPVIEATPQAEGGLKETTEAASIEESLVVTELVPKEDPKEREVEVSDVTSEDDSLNPKSVICNTSTASTDSEIPKVAAEIVPDEAMDVDEANSCHSTDAVAEGEEMTVADQSEPMDSE